MISLFNVPPYIVDTNRFSNVLHDKIVRHFEESFCEYVGARYACSLNSATSGIFLMLSALVPEDEVHVPSIIPTVVPDAILNAGCMLRFVDNVHWVGNSYILHTFTDNLKIIDSAQKVERNQFAKEANNEDLMLFSFYPTKPVGSVDGGIIVSNNESVIQHLKEISFNGTTRAENNWDRVKIRIGHKMYMNAVQAFIANENLNRLDYKKGYLEAVRERYNKAFGYNNTSDHLYRVKVHNNEAFKQKACDAGITCGIHYQAAHLLKVYQENIGVHDLPVSEMHERHTVSIPFHEALTTQEIQKVIDFTLPFLYEE